MMSITSEWKSAGSKWDLKHFPFQPFLLILQLPRSPSKSVDKSGCLVVSHTRHGSPPHCEVHQSGRSGLQITISHYSWGIPIPHSWWVQRRWVPSNRAAVQLPGTLRTYRLSHTKIAQLSSDFSKVWVGRNFYKLNFRRKSKISTVHPFLSVCIIQVRHISYLLIGECFEHFTDSSKCRVIDHWRNRLSLGIVESTQNNMS